MTGPRGDTGNFGTTGPAGLPGACGSTGQKGYVQLENQDRKDIMVRVSYRGIGAPRVPPPEIVTVSIMRVLIFEDVQNLI